MSIFITLIVHILCENTSKQIIKHKITSYNYPYKSSCFSVCKNKIKGGGGGGILFMPTVPFSGRTVFDNNF